MNGRDLEDRRKPRRKPAAQDLGEYLDEIIAQAPPMSAQARARLAVLLGPSARRAA